MDMQKNSLPGFTLIELIVVMAIIVTLSVIGFISYNGYVRDSRNATRTAMLEEANTAIERFMFTEGRPPRCNPKATTGPAVCYFAPGTGTALDTKKATAVESGVTCTPANTCLPMLAGVINGVDANDWSKMNLKNNPEDPSKVYYLYATDGNSKYALLATKEDDGSYSTLLKGHKAIPLPFPTPTAPIPDYMLTELGVNTVNGFTVTSGSISGTAAAIKYEGNTVVPYRNVPDAS